MQQKPLITAIIGSYRAGGVMDQAVDEVLDAARDAGAEVLMIQLRDRPLAFCSNCRSCTQEPGVERGHCILDDDLSSILEVIDRSSGLILASPSNFGTVTALMKRFIERLVCYAWWPWGARAPRIRPAPRGKRAVLLVTSAAPAPVTRLATPIFSLLKKAAKAVGARPVGSLCIGLAASAPDQPLTARTRAAARRLGRLLLAD